jgi:glutaredoxin-like protein
MRPDPDLTTTPDVTAAVADVYWRPGCPYCATLRRDLERLGVPTRWHNIWADPDARQFVRGVNRGDETVPTVAVGRTTLTNPRAAQVAALLGDRDERPPSRARRVGAILSWLPVVAVVGVSEYLAHTGHGALSWALDAVAVAAWWATRPLRR